MKRKDMIRKIIILPFLVLGIIAGIYHQNNRENIYMPIKKIESKINYVIDEQMLNMKPSGSVLIAINNQIIYCKSFGYADLINKIPTSMDTQFLVGSVTKQFTAVAILKALFDKNIQMGINANDSVDLKNHVLADLGRAIDFYLPENHAIWNGSMPAWAKIVTVHQLLIHSSGIPSYTSLPDFENHDFAKASDLVTFFKTHELEFTPGTKFSYSNSGYFLLGIIAQQITNLDLDVYMQEKLFEPIEMRSSFLATKGTVNNLIKSDARFVNLARGYQYDITIKNASLNEINNYVSMQIPGAGGSLISTTSDLLKWNNALYTGKIIPNFLIELMTHPYILTEQAKDYYGYGVDIIQSDSLGEYYTHKGGIPGFRSKLTFIPSLQLSIVVLENLVENMDSVKSEIDKIKTELPQTLSENEKQKEIDKILESKYPNIVENRKRYELMLVEENIIKALENETK
jgi:CubicO group peptidase (beta-lactamase class C family)